MTNQPPVVKLGYQRGEHRPEPATTVDEDQGWLVAVEVARFDDVYSYWWILEVDKPRLCVDSGPLEYAILSSLEVSPCGRRIWRVERLVLFFHWYCHRLLRQ